MSIRKLRAMLWIALPLLGAGVALASAETRRREADPLAGIGRTVVRIERSPLEGFALRDHHGEAFGPTRLRGHWSLVFLGYTSCPDVCPTTLAVLAPTARRLAEEQLDVRTYFVTVDPERDDAARLEGYLSGFDAPITGVTGDRAALARLAEGLGGAMATSAGGRIDHPTSVFVVSPEGRPVGALLRPVSPGRLMRDLAQLRAGER